MMMKKVFDFLKKSNHWKHILGGFVAGLCVLSPLGALYVSAVAASCLEVKDMLYGNCWDWTDWLLTLFGGSLAAILWLIV